MSVLGVMAEHWFAIAVFFGAIVRRPLWSSRGTQRLAARSAKRTRPSERSTRRRRLDDEKDDDGGSSQG